MICYRFDKPLLQSIEELFRNCGKDIEFMNNYIMNSVLSYIEEREQDLALGMQYNEWVDIDERTKDEIKEQIINYITRFIIACNGTGKYYGNYLDKVKEEIENNGVIEKSLCYLYVFGIYGDCISRYILIKSPDGDELPDYEIHGDVTDRERAIKAFNECVKKLRKWNEYRVRSRFIEIVRDLYLLKQRFPDKSVYESYMLVDRVFAYAYPRYLPLGVYTVNDVCDKDKLNLRRIAYNFFRSYHDYLVGGHGTKNMDTPENEFEVFWEILCGFLRNAFGNRRLYRFQVRGIETAIRKLMDIFNAVNNQRTGKVDYLVIAAPTGSGKTEVMVLSILIAALARKIILLMHGFNDDRSTPIALIVYPRRSLANDQVSRLIEYLSIINEELNEKFRQRSDLISLTINYTDIRYKKEYEDAINSIKDKIDTKPIPLPLKYGVSAFLVNDHGNYYVELRFLTCPRKLVSSIGSIYPRLKVIKKGDKYEVDDSVVYCGNNELKFMALTKDRVKERLGDVHITIFETLRHNLLSRGFNDLFGTCRESGNGRKVFDYPLIIALDEIHTYTDISGVRYAYMLRRVLNRIRYKSKECGDSSELPGNLVIGMSATIPNARDFLGDLFFSEDIKKRIDDYLITVNEEETIPLGNEYFIITVPTRKAPVDALTVSIQTIMNTFYNISSIPIGDGYVKKAIVFMEEFNVLRRIKRELYNEERGAIFRKEKINDKFIVVGLQDLRNPRNQYFYNTTLEDYGDKTDIINDIARGRISKVVDIKSWLDGELWWGYMLDTIVNHYQDNPNIYTSTKFNSVIEYSSKWRDDVGGAAVIVSTSALEVGVDYSDVVLIYQHGAPPSISSLIQRAGRGGRRLFENPLMRIIVGIQLSPDLPHQSWLFEIFTRVKDLRKALDYDRLFLPKESEEIQRQVLVELVLEYYILINGEATRENWECEFVNWLRKNKETVIDYSRWVFDKIEQKRLDLLIDEVIGDFNNICKKGAEVKV